VNPVYAPYVGLTVGVINPEERAQLNDNWESLPPNVAQYGRSADEMKNIPYGAIAMHTFADKLAAGLRQLLAGVRKFNASEISRDEVFSADRKAEKETGISSDVLDDAAKRILKA
jgi:uncharacterized phage infection (PIP) family protein YhgE